MYEMSVAWWDIPVIYPLSLTALDIICRMQRTFRNLSEKSTQRLIFPPLVMRT